MLKFFAKYQKYILAVGGTVLMVAFLIPSADFLMPDLSAYTIGHIDGQPVTSADQQRAGYELQALGIVRSHVAQYQQANRNTPLPPLLNLLGGAQFPDDPLQWLLLSHEASRHGIYSTAFEAEQVLQEMNTAGLDVRRIVSQAGGHDLLISALQHWRMFLSLAGMSYGSNPPSEPRLRQFARGLQGKVTLQLVALDPQKVAEQPDPTDEQLNELFEKHKSQRPGESKPYGFGYKLPARVKIEYIALPLKRVIESIKVDEVEARRYYIEHKNEFLPPPPPPLAPEKPEAATPDEEEPAEDKSTEDKTAEETPTDEKPSEPGACQVEPPVAEPKKSSESKATTEALPDPTQPLPYKEVREKVINKLARQQGIAKQEEIVKFISAELRKDVEPPLTGPDFEAVAKAVQEKYGILPDVVTLDTWQSLKEISELPDIGKASLMQAGRPIPVTTYIASLPVLGLDKQGTFANLGMKVGVASRPVMDYDSNAYVFRVNAAEAERDPQDLAEVRDKVTRDWKEMKAYEEVKSRADALADRVKTEGLEAIAKQYELKVEEVGPVSLYDEFMMQYTGRLVTPTVPVIGRSEAFIEQAMALGEKVEAAGGVEKAEEALTVGVIPVDSVRKICLVKVKEFTTIDNKMFEMARPFFQQTLGQLEAQQVVPHNPLSLEALKKNMGFVEVAYEKEDDGHDEHEGHDHEDRDHRDAKK